MIMNKQELIKEIITYLDTELERASDKVNNILTRLIGDRVAVLNLADRILSFLPFKVVELIADYTIRKAK